MKYRDAPFDVVLEIGHQSYVMKIKGAQWAQRVRRDGTLLGVTDVAADLEVEVIGKVNSDAVANESAHSAAKPKRDNTKSADTKPKASSDAGG